MKAYSIAGYRLKYPAISFERSEFMSENYYGGKIIPFFMAYPLERFLDGREESERDREYLTALYPQTAKQIQNLIREELALRDYKESVIYDEYPDRIGLSMIANAVYERADGIENREHRRDLIEVLLYQEILERRHQKKDMFYL